MSFLLNALFPDHCLSCDTPSSHSLCDVCSHQLILLDATERCPTCFHERTGLCHRCHKNPMPFDRLAAALRLATTSPLLRALKQNQTHLARPLASFLIAQLHELDWPTPDIIIPVPQPWPQRLLRGYNHAHLLAKETAKLLDRPLATPLSRRPGDFPQSALSPDERRQLTRDHFRLHRHTLHDKILLLVDDSMTTGTTMRRCGEHLRDAFPDRIYGLTVAMTDREYNIENERLTFAL